MVVSGSSVNDSIESPVSKGLIEACKLGEMFPGKFPLNKRP